MTNTLTKENLFKPRKSTQETKADNTTRVARQMIDAEASSREAKTNRLREARLAKEEAERESEPVAPSRQTRAKARGAKG